ncbi:hypothetical protein PACTADRAFT_47580 [Pachysolen tannophilus NRRL Y-2460]|uniref:Dolichyl-diphosphooligosaccharide--protein glycosyltransferase subunit WBP1 n=1 Tax=Pachysolen tannophilus NRRL Y-2460 TaxID=669874 RepID=A0A1E4U146_PACTA|nr:hypothetical protein PACTADRAFT_47580 [Pachysolen tannophilus NRRL Y-2460]
MSNSFVYGLRKSVLPDKSTLIIYDDRIINSLQDEYSKFLEDLESKEYKLNYFNLGEESRSENLKLFVNSERLYQNLIIFPSKMKTLGKEVSAAEIIEFANEGGNIMVITSPDGLQDDVNIYLNQIGIYPSPRNYKTVDHFNFDSKLGSKTHDVLKLAKQNIKNELIVSEDVNELLYSGSSALLSNGQLLVPIVEAPSTSYTINKDGEFEAKSIWSSGTQSFFVVGLQSRNNARTVWLGSSDFLSDKFYQTNGKLINDIIDWCFQAKGVIKSTFVEHYHSNDKSNQEIYKITDDVVYDIGITEWNGEEWVPYIADDVQVELRMLDPYYRITLQPKSEINESQVYTTGSFKLPDQHGMFTFYTNYKRSGLSYIEDRKVVTVRHLANDEYQRSWEITNSWVYVASNVTVVVSWFIFVILFLFQK